MATATNFRGYKRQILRTSCIAGTRLVCFVPVRVYQISRILLLKYVSPVTSLIKKFLILLDTFRRSLDTLNKMKVQCGILYVSISGTNNRISIQSGIGSLF
jgi:hypothetical protein